MAIRLTTRCQDVVDRIMKEYFEVITETIEECVNCLVRDI